jgi:septal ring factor EnvC (AmiA/AmiB activator)
MEVDIYAPNVGNYKSFVNDDDNYSNFDLRGKKYYNRQRDIEAANKAAEEAARKTADAIKKAEDEAKQAEEDAKKAAEEEKEAQKKKKEAEDHAKKLAEIKSGTTPTPTSIDDTISGGTSGGGKSTPKWVLPVAIGGGVVLLLVVVLALKKN